MWDLHRKRAQLSTIHNIIYSFQYLHNIYDISSYNLDQLKKQGSRPELNQDKKRGD